MVYQELMAIGERISSADDKNAVVSEERFYQPFGQVIKSGVARQFFLEIAQGFGCLFKIRKTFEAITMVVGRAPF